MKQGIDMKLLVGDLPTGVASTFISPDGERTFGTYLGAAATMKAENLTLDMFKGYAYLYIEGYLVQDHELILRAMQLGKKRLDCKSAWIWPVIILWKGTWNSSIF